MRSAVKWNWLVVATGLFSLPGLVAPPIFVMPCWQARSTS